MKQLRIIIALAGSAIAAAAPASASEFKCDRAKSQAIIMKAAKAQIIYEMGVVAGTLNVTVDDQTWSEIPFSTKENMAREIGCAVLGPSKQFQSILFLSYMSHKVLGEYSLNALTVK
jgi:hypothetical protein